MTVYDIRCLISTGFTGFSIDLWALFQSALAHHAITRSFPRFFDPDFPGGTERLKVCVRARRSHPDLVKLMCHSTITDNREYRSARRCHSGRIHLCGHGAVPPQVEDRDPRVSIVRLCCLARNAHHHHHVLPTRSNDMIGRIIALTVTTNALPT